MVLGSPFVEKTDLAGSFLVKMLLELAVWRPLLLGDVVCDISV